MWLEQAAWMAWKPTLCASIVLAGIYMLQWRHAAATGLFHALAEVTAAVGSSSPELPADWAPNTLQRGAHAGS